MAVDWRGALAYPFRGPERERPVVATWVLLLLAVAAPALRFVNVLGLAASLLFAVPVVGYLVRVLVASENGEPAPGLLTNWPQLLRQGLAGLVVCFVYLVIPFVLLAITIYGALYTDQVPDPNSFSNLTIYAGSTAVLTMALIGAYLLPIALASYGQRNSLHAAFSGSALRAVVTKAAYFAGWTTALGVFGFVASIALGVSGAHRGGPLVGTAIVAYLLLFTVHVWGRALARVR